MEERSAMCRQQESVSQAKAKEEVVVIGEQSGLTIH